MTRPRTVEIELVGGARDGRRCTIDRDLLRLWSDTSPNPATPGIHPRRYHYQWKGRYLAADHRVRVYEFVGETAVGERLHPAGQGGTA
jgi:hypothetical protein